MVALNAMPRYRLDASWTRPGRGPVALGGSPLTLFRLTPGGQRIADALENGDELPDGNAPLTDRLLDAGALHPDVVDVLCPDASRVADVDVVIPVHDEDLTRLQEMVASLRRSPHVGQIVIVDDCSATPLDVIVGAHVLRLDANSGPATARNAGFTTTAASAVLFIDADVTCDDPVEVIDALVRHLDDDRVALVAPRIVARPGDDALAAFEAFRSPLDLGPQPARIRALTRVSYVPAAMILVRREAFDAAGGFDQRLRFGEDVDLVWRLDEAGWRCRYEPSVAASHDVRPTFEAWFRQRLAYGTSAAALDERHDGAVAPVRLGRWSLAAWLTGVLVHPLAGISVAGATTAEFARRLGDVPDRTTLALRYAGLGHLHAGRLLARALTRTWWPIALGCALISRRARRVVLLAALGPALIEWSVRRPPIDPARYVALSLADDVAYGTGVWIGCLRERRFGALAPSITR